MKKILVIQGGGSAKGNIAQLISHFVMGAEESGHLVEMISLLIQIMILSFPLNLTKM